MEEPAQAHTEAEEVGLEEEERLPFPNARVVKIIKENLSHEHQLKKDVKLAANNLLAEILSDISKTMDEEAYFTLSIEHFNKAARKYREIELAHKRVYRIKKLLEKQRAEIDEMIAEIELESMERV
jgi:hypothetical protein